MKIITLPRESLIYMDKEKIMVEIPDKYQKKINMKNINEARGIWKDKNINPVDYQKKIRSEWD